MKLLSFYFSFLLIHAQASTIEPVLKVEHTSGWTFTSLPQSEVIALFTGGAEAELTTGKLEDKTLSTVYVYKLNLPKHISLNSTKAEWHKLIFPNRATVKTNVLAEKVYMFDGQPRYYIEFQSDTGTMLHSAVLAVVVDGELHVLTYENSREEYIKTIPSVRELFRTVTFHLGT